MNLEQFKKLLEKDGFTEVKDKRWLLCMVNVKKGEMVAVDKRGKVEEYDMREIK